MGILAGLGVIAGLTAAGGAYYGASKWMMQVILGRKPPRHMKIGTRLFSGSNVLTEYAEEISAAARTLEAHPGLEPVTVTAADGVRLAGHWYGHPNPKRVIIAMHGWRSGWSRDFGFIAEDWFRGGCSVLFAEQRGQNNSGGDYMGFGMLERHDCLTWIRWVEGHTGGRLPIYLSGISMGATTVLMAAGLDLPASVKGIVADCGFTSPHAIWKHVTEKNLHLPYLIQGEVANRLCRRQISIGSKDCTAPDALKKATVPVLFIHGTADKFVPVEMTYENYLACASEKYLLIVPGAQHGMAYHVDRPAYRKAVADFWAKCDARG